jgi:hypothetical protein
MCISSYVNMAVYSPYVFSHSPPYSDLDAGARGRRPSWRTAGATTYGAELNEKNKKKEERKNKHFKNSQKTKTQSSVHS